MQQTRRMRLNIVGTSNVSSVKSTNRLQTFVIAVAFVNSEKAYNCILKGLIEAIWSSEGLYELPSVFVTDNKTALRHTIDAVFSESDHLLCYWHLWNAMETKLAIGTVESAEYKYRRCLAEKQSKAIVLITTIQQYHGAITKFKEIVTTPGYFEDNSKTA